MRLPFVSRSMHEETLAIALSARDSEKENARILRSSLADITAKYHQLRQQGYEVPPPPAVAPERREIDPLEQMVNERARGDKVLRFQMMRQLRADRASQVPDDQIALAINGGMSVIEDGVPA